MSGTRINASRMEPLNRVAAIIQPRLRVRILPVDSKVESSNTACLPGTIQPRRPGSEEGRSARRRRADRSAPPDLWTIRGAGSGALWPSVHPNRNHCACVDTDGARSVPGLLDELRQSCASCVTLQKIHNGIRWSWYEIASLVFPCSSRNRNIPCTGAGSISWSHART